MIERIKEVIDYSQLSAAAFADTIGISRSGLTHLLTGRNQPSLDVARKILAKFPEVSTEWLIMGMGEMMRSEEPLSNPSSSSIVQEEPAYPVENSKFDNQTDLFGDYANPDDSDEDMASNVPMPHSKEKSEQVVNEEDTSLPAQQDAVIPDETATHSVEPPRPATVRVQNTPTRGKRSQDAKTLPAPSKRERMENTVPAEKKLQKIVFFYDDHSFEVYS